MIRDERKEVSCDCRESAAQGSHGWAEPAVGGVLAGRSWEASR